MLIQALCEYYDVLVSQGKVLPEGYSSVGISYLISLTPEGEMDGIIDCRNTQTYDVKGKPKQRKTPKSVVMPKRTEKPGIDGNVVEHRPLYIFGLNHDSKTNTLSSDDATSKARKSHAAFVEKNREFLADIDSPVCAAVRGFLEKWAPEAETENPLLLSLGKEFSASTYFDFCLSGHPEITLHDCPDVRNKWDRLYARRAEGEETTVAQCGILGKRLPIARIHAKIKGVPGGNPTGNTLVSFNNSAEYSYGKEQSYNSNISVSAMEKYTQALNYLLSDRKHKSTIDDVTVLHWAASNDESCDDLFNMLVAPDGYSADEVDNMLAAVMKGTADGVLRIDIDDVERNIDPGVTFYIVGLKPNSARLAVKFVYRQRFGKIVDNLAQHQRDMQIRQNQKPVPMWRIKNELVPPKSKNYTVDPELITRLLESAVYGKPYPSQLFGGIIRRIRSDSDTETNSFVKMNDTRMGVLKAYINRNRRMKGQEEEIKLALDTNNKNPAYLCGRLFAVLEGIQQRASGYNLNRTIKDAYFTSASARPAVVFPKLLALSQHHMAKLDNPRYADGEIAQIVDMLGASFPNMLSLTQQGEFMLGYYQQKSYTSQRIKEYKDSKGE